MYNAISKQYWTSENKKSLSYTCVDEFIEQFFELFYDKNFNDAVIISHVHDYIENIPENEIEGIIMKYCNDKTISNLTNIYCNMFNSIEIVNKNDVVRFECKNIKMDMSRLILYNIITNVHIVY